MPSNEDFTFHILVADTVLPEYEKDGIHYIESNLFTPVSYSQRTVETINGEIESQNWPVTPYVIRIEAKPSTSHCYYRIFVDGQIAKKCSVAPGAVRIIKGFRDGLSIKEFCFSLPRFARDETDRIDVVNEIKVGHIEVECYNARLQKTEMKHRHKSLNYDQANKKDCNNVTHGKYLMATTKAGRIVKTRTPYNLTDFWKVTSLRSSLSVKYVTAQTLQDMHFAVIPIPFPHHLNLTARRSDSDRDLSANYSSPKEEKKIKKEILSVYGEAKAGGVTVLNRTNNLNDDDVIVLD